jgi:predicted nucleotidyltransferase
MVDALSSYRDTMRRRGRQARREQEQRRRRAQRTARHVAEYLRRTYGVDRVVLFGSMADDEVPLGPRSDIDLAVEGLEKKNYYEAVARVQDEGAPFQVDLVRIEQCPESLREAVRREGREP